MTTAWRIVKSRRVGSAFDGEGARRYGGRWNTPGTSVVYTSESRALCLLEVLAGIRSVNAIGGYVLISVGFDDGLVTTVDPRTLPEDWRRSPPHQSTQGIGDDWVDQRISAVLRVPSAIVPEEFNFVLNAAHQDFVRIKIGVPQEISIDPRLVR